MAKQNSPRGRVNIFEAFTVERSRPFDLDRLADKFRHRNMGWSIPEAYLGILFCAAMADGHFGGEETDAIRGIARRSRALAALSPSDLAMANNVVNQRLHDNPQALVEACQTLPADMCLPVFAHCVDIALSDGELLQAEAEFLHSLVPMLDIEPDNARRVMEVLLLKAQY